MQMAIPMPKMDFPKENGFRQKFLLRRKMLTEQM